MTSSEKSLPEKHGIYKQTLNLPDGTLLRYTLSIPSTFSPQKPVPLVMALHYGGAVTPWYGSGFLTTLVEPALIELNAIIIAPDCPGKGWDNLFSESAVMTLLNYLKEHYSIDNKRILVTGFSMGGVGAWYMIARHPDIFSAAIPIASATDKETLDKIGNIPIYVIHSNKDEIFPLKPMEETVETLKKRGSSIQLIVVDGISHYHTGRFVEPLSASIPWLKEIWGE